MEQLTPEEIRNTADNWRRALEHLATIEPEPWPPIAAEWNLEPDTWPELDTWPKVDQGGG